MRVGIVTEQLRRPTPGGIGRYASSLLRALDQRSDIDSVAIAGVLPPNVTSRLWAAGGVIRKRTDLIHATSFSYPRVIPRIPTTVFIHDVLWRGAGSDALNPRGIAFHERGLARVLRNGGAVLVPSEAVAAGLIACGLDRGLVTVTGEGSDHLPIVKRNIAEPYLLSVGTFEPRKNLRRMLAAYELLREHINPVPPLRLVGSDAWRGMAGLPSALPVGVEIIGRVNDDELAGLYAGASAFVYPSLGEGFGLPPLEAMRAGVPTICSAVPSVMESIGGSTDGGEHVFLVDPSSTESIMDAMRSVLTDHVRAEGVAVNGKAWAERRTWANVAERHVQLWRTLR